jgi:hypothetical protein
MNWLLYLTLGKDRDEPFASYLPDCDVPCVTKDLPAVAVADPTEFRKENPTVFLIDFKFLREAKAFVLPLLLELRRSYEPIWIDLAGLQLLERFKVSGPTHFRDSSVTVAAPAMARPSTRTSLALSSIEPSLRRARHSQDGSRIMHSSPTATREHG